MKEIELLLVCTDRFEQARDGLSHWLGSPRMRLAENVKGKDAGRPRAQVIIVSPRVATAIMADGGVNYEREKARAHRGRRVRTRTIPTDLVMQFRPQERTVRSENVLAYIEGSDKKEELVVVTAHYDHIGTHDGEVYNGADDDGSGTVALLEMAQAFALAKAQGHGPKRSILFMPAVAR